MNPQVTRDLARFAHILSEVVGLPLVFVFIARLLYAPEWLQIGFFVLGVNIGFYRLMKSRKQTQEKDPQP